MMEQQTFYHLMYFVLPVFTVSRHAVKVQVLKNLLPEPN